MRLLDSSFEIIEQEPSLLGIYKQIEKAARVSYKSEDKITEGSAQRMVDTLIKNKHYACLEHGTVYLEVPYNIKREDPSGNDWAFFSSDHLIPRVGEGYYGNRYSRVHPNPYKQCNAITTNVRVLVENGWLDDLKYLCEPTEYHEKRITVKFTTSIGVGREMTRHRVFSFMQESTRYCNYSKDKFDNQLSIIIPQWIYDCAKDRSQYIDALDGSSMKWLLNESGENLVNSLTCIDRTVACWYDTLMKIEDTYMFTTTSDESYTLKPQEARGVLPLDLKSELVMTGFVSDWKHFFELRSIGTTGKPHPDIEVLATGLLKEFKDRSLLDDQWINQWTKFQE